MSFKFKMKKAIAKIFYIFGINNLMLKKLNNKYKNNYIRVVNYHGTPEKYKDNFEKQVKWIMKHFEICDLNKLKLFLQDKYTFTTKPGFIFTFDDGYHNNYTVAYQILKKFNICGFFFVSTGLIGKVNNNQKNYIYSDQNYMDKNELLELINNNQVIGCHTYTHHRMNINDDNSVLQYEIYDAKKDLEKILNREIEIFCWPGGEKHTYTKAASDVIKKSGYKFSFLTNSFPVLPNNNPLLLERSNLETLWPISLIQFQLSGLIDKKLNSKRQRVENLIK